MAHRSIKYNLIWAVAAVWVFALFVSANVSYYVYIHEPAVKAQNIRLAQVQSEHRAVTRLAQTYSSDIQRLENILADMRDPGLFYDR